jgi:hypothetical protein
LQIFFLAQGQPKKNMEGVVQLPRDLALNQLHQLILQATQLANQLQVVQTPYVQVPAVQWYSLFPQPILPQGDDPKGGIVNVPIFFDANQGEQNTVVLQPPPDTGRFTCELIADPRNSLFPYATILVR